MQAFPEVPLVLHYCFISEKRQQQKVKTLRSVAWVLSLFSDFETTTTQTRPAGACRQCLSVFVRARLETVLCACVNVYVLFLFFVFFVKYCKCPFYYVPSLCLTEPVLPPLLTPFSNNAVCTFLLNKCTVNSKNPRPKYTSHTHIYMRVPWCAWWKVYRRLSTNWTYSSCVLTRKCPNLCFYAFLYYRLWCVTVFSYTFPTTSLYRKVSILYLSFFLLD